MWGRCSGGGSRPRPQHCTGIALCTFCNFHCSLLHSSYNLVENRNPPRVGNGNTQCAIICSAPPLIRVLAPLTGEYAVIYCYHQWSATTVVIIITATTIATITTSGQSPPPPSPPPPPVVSHHHRSYHHHASAAPV